MGKRQLSILAAFSALLISSPASATIISASDTDDDATVTLTLESVVVGGITGPWGTVRILVTSAAVAFTAGDMVSVSVLEDDIAGDDPIFQTAFEIEAGELAAGLVDRSFELFFDPLAIPEADNVLEIYASAMVDKDACGLLCAQDSPETGILEIVIERTSVPEPLTASLLLVGLIGVAANGRRRARTLI